jgi:hypothetical protein
MVKGDLAVEESLNKSLYKIVLYSIKILPIVISGIYVLNTILSYCGIDLPLFSYIVQFLFISMMYILSHTFKFCKWHRIYIHYILLTLLINIYDYHIGIPISDKDLFIFYMMLTIICLFAATYIKFKHERVFNKICSQTDEGDC